MDYGKLIWLGLGLLLPLLTYLSLSQRQREVVAKRLLPHTRRRSSTLTPPRSLSPFQKDKASATDKANEYAGVFPPSQRLALKDLSTTLNAKQRQLLGNLAFDQTTFEDNLLGWEDDYRLCDESKYIASGFSIKEIKALGDFPDYAALSDVPNPQPYHNFDIDKAVPRPYRPFRWAYHQTMCEYSSTVAGISSDSHSPDQARNRLVD